MARRPMTREERYLLDALRSAGEPISPRKLVEDTDSRELSASGLRDAIWLLVDRGEARFSPERKIYATHMPEK